jgi:ABC-2 type transport system ATP-binding protein
MDAIPAKAPGAALDASGREVVLRTDGLTKRFGQRTVVNQLALEVRRGDVFGLLGPNGSGKTTTLRMILSLIVPTAGSVSLFGESSTGGNHRAALRRVGAIVEQPAFYPYLTGRENLRGVATFAGLSDTAATRARVEDVLTQVGLAPRARDSYKKYSLGMKQRLGIAAALLTDPELVVLDEPTNGLDPAGMVEVRALIGQLSQRGITVLLSSHLLYEVQQVCTRVAILKEGMLLAQGQVSDLTAGHGGIQLAFDEPTLLPRAAEIVQGAMPSQPWIRGFQYVRPEPGAWTPPGGWILRVDAPVERAAEVNRLLAAQGVYAAEVRRGEASLEQYFLALTDEKVPQHATTPWGAAGVPQGGQA